jgi:hypothetical protein
MNAITADTDVWYVTINDGWTTCCLPCATERVRSHVSATLDHGMHGDARDAAYRRLGAALRLDRHGDADAIYRRLEDHWANMRYSVDRCSFVGGPIFKPGTTGAEVDRYYASGDVATAMQPRNEAAMTLLRSLVRNAHSSNLSDSHWGESCEDCGAQLEPAWITCRACDREGDADSFPFVEGIPVDSNGDRPKVSVCGKCNDAVLVNDDGRQYTLRYDEERKYDSRFDKEYGYERFVDVGEDYLGGEYLAGCRRFTFDEALGHWSDETHFDPDSADILFRAVLCHAMRRWNGNRSMARRPLYNAEGAAIANGGALLRRPGL